MGRYGVHSFGVYLGTVGQFYRGVTLSLSTQRSILVGIFMDTGTPPWGSGVLGINSLCLGSFY